MIRRGSSTANNKRRSGGNSERESKTRAGKVNNVLGELEHI